MTIIDDKLEIDRTPARTAAADVPAPAGRPRKRGALAAVAAIVVAVGLTIGLAAVAVQIATSTDQNDQPRPASQPDADVVVGAGPHSVFVGSAPTFGGDPARGETDESYFARTGRHLPGTSSAIIVEGSWWYGSLPVVGGDPAPGETDVSYYGRTGRHLPSQDSRGDEYIRDLVARGVVPAASLDDGTQIESGEATD
jgi:hypothetical protein